MKDVIVIGTGPAGLALAASLRARDVDVVSVGPDAPWPNNYGIWLDELESVGLESFHTSVWPRTVVRLDEARVHTVERAYARVDNDRLRAHFLDRLKDRRIEQAVERVQSDRVVLDDGRTLEARMIVDATGAASSFTERTAHDRDSVAAQVAVGLRVEVVRHPFPLDEVLLMDFSDAFDPVDVGPPTFLYAMPFSETELFVEETVLVSRPPADPAWLRARLDARLAALGVEVTSIREVEQCFIPMGRPIPSPQDVLAYGGAAEMVHPATGYMLNRALAWAEDIGKEIARVVASSDLSAASRARQTWSVLWSPPRRRAFRLYRYGMRTLLALDVADTRDFFDAFFRTEPRLWQAYLRGADRARDVLASMRATFGRLPARLKLKVAFGPRPRKLDRR